MRAHYIVKYYKNKKPIGKRVGIKSFNDVLQMAREDFKKDKKCVGFKIFVEGVNTKAIELHNELKEAHNG